LSRGKKWKGNKKFVVGAIHELPLQSSEKKINLIEKKLFFPKGLSIIIL